MCQGLFYYMITEEKEMEQILNFKNLGAYCVFQIIGGQIQIKVRTRTEKKYILLTTYSANKARTATRILQ